MTDILNKRTRNSKTYVNPDGSFTSHITLHDQHYPLNGGWDDIDPYLESYSETDPETGDAFTHRCVKAPFHVSLNRYKQPRRITFPGEDPIRIKALNCANEAGTKSNNVIYYPGPWPGLASRLTVTPNGVKEDIIKVGQDTPDYIQWRVSGPFAAHLQPAFARVGPLGIERLDFPIVVNGDIATMDLMALRALPIATEIDPTLNLVNDDWDRHLRASNPTYNAEGGYVGGYGSPAMMREVQKWTTSGFTAGSTIDSAALTCTVNSQAGTGAGNVTMYRILTTPTTGVTWDKKDGTNVWPGSAGCSTAGADYDSTYPSSTLNWSTNGDKAHDIKNLLQASVNAAETVLYVLITPATATNGNYSSYVTNFYGQPTAPRMAVTYTPATGSIFAIENSVIGGGIDG